MQPFFKKLEIEWVRMPCQIAKAGFKRKTQTLPGTSNEDKANGNWDCVYA